MQIEDGSHTPGVLRVQQLRCSPKGLPCNETRVAFLPAPLTARAVGTISKQAGLSIPGISGQESGIRNDRCIPAAGTWKTSMLVKGQISEIGNRHA
jgi:hypothetical protein